MVDLCHVDVGQGKPCFCYPPSTAETALGSASTLPNKGEYAFGANVQQDVADAMGSRLPRAPLTMTWFGGPGRPRRYRVPYFKPFPYPTWRTTQSLNGLSSHRREDGSDEEPGGGDFLVKKSCDIKFPKNPRRSLYLSTSGISRGGP